MADPNDKGPKPGDRYRHSLTGAVFVVIEVKAGRLVCFTNESGKVPRISPLLLRTFLRDFARLPAEHP